MTNQNKKTRPNKTYGALKHISGMLVVTQPSQNQASSEAKLMQSFETTHAWIKSKFKNDCLLQNSPLTQKRENLGFKSSNSNDSFQIFDHRRADGLKFKKIDAVTFYMTMRLK